MNSQNFCWTKRATLRCFRISVTKKTLKIRYALFQIGKIKKKQLFFLSGQALTLPLFFAASQMCSLTLKIYTPKLMAGTYLGRGSACCTQPRRRRGSAGNLSTLATSIIQASSSLFSYFQTIYVTIRSTLFSNNEQFLVHKKQDYKCVDKLFSNVQTLLQRIFAV